MHVVILQSKSNFSTVLFVTVKCIVTCVEDSAQQDLFVIECSWIHMWHMLPNALNSQWLQYELIALHQIDSILPWSTSYSQCVLTIAAASLWGMMCNIYGICECRSPTDHADTSQRMCHNCSCGMRAVKKLTWYCTRIGSTPNEVSQGPSLQLDLPLLVECTSVSKHLFMPIACVTTRLW